MTVDFGGLEVKAPSNYSYKHRTHRTNLIELCYLVWIITQIGKHYLSVTCPLTAMLAPPSSPQPPHQKKNPHETDDLKNDKHSCTEH